MKRLARITQDHPNTDLPTARRIIGQAAAFLTASAALPGAQLSPSKAVDAGWHTFILHTLDYAEFCERVAGRFIHHVPTPNAETKEASASVRAACSSRAPRGIPNRRRPVARHGQDHCSQCHADCSNSPNTGTK